MPKTKSSGRHFFTYMKLRHRFALQLGGMATTTFVLFFFYAQYSLDVTQKEFEHRSILLSETLGAQSALDMVMEDTEGLVQNLDLVVRRGSALAGAFFDSAGDIVAAHSFRARIAEKDRPLNPAAPLRWAETTDGVAVLLSTAEVRLNDENRSGDLLGHVVLAVPADAIQAQRRTISIISFAIPALIALLTWLILIQVRRTVTRPVEQLREAAGAVEQGKLNVRVNILQHDEIGALAASFNAMVESLERSTMALQEQTEQAEAAQRQAEVLQRRADEERQYLQEQFEAISRVIAAVTRGDLTQRINVSREDRVGALMREINQMIHDLAALIREVHLTGVQLSEAAHRVASSAEEMSAGANEQASQTIEVAAAVEEMSATIAESSRNAFEANEMAKRAADLASEGELVFQETTEGMKRIAGLVKDSTQKVTLLGNSSAQIGEIIQVIGGIADQTNLLALNAAIEAARAGEQGRGFAVVADEVRKLAERTSEATKQIGEMITRIQHNTDEVVASMTRGNEEVEAGLRQADNASHSLTEIISSINRMVLMIDQIAAASQQQSTASSQISQNVESISSVAREVSTATAELAFTADGMNGHVDTLSQLIERFTVDLNASKPVPYPGGDGASRYPV